MNKKMVIVCILAILFTASAYADITFTYTTTGAEVIYIGHQTGYTGDWDHLLLTGVVNASLVLKLNVPVLAKLNDATFLAGFNCDGNNIAVCSSQTGPVDRTLNSVTISNQWTIDISSSDTLTIKDGAPIYIGGVKITPMGEVFRSDGNTADSKELMGTFEYVPEPGATLMLLGGALVGLETLRRRLRA